MDHILAVDKVELGECQDAIAVKGLLGVEVEAGERLERRAGACS
jgi:hypothetical protein